MKGCTPAWPCRLPAPLAAVLISVPRRLLLPVLAAVLCTLPLPTARAFTSAASPPAYLDPDTDWYAEAARRIDVIRKGSLSLEVVDRGGRPIPGATVRLTMQRHLFAFGSLVVDSLVAGSGSDSERYREHILRLFNKAVLPLGARSERWRAASPPRFSSLAWLRQHGIPVRAQPLVHGEVRPGDPVPFDKTNPAPYRAALLDLLRRKAATVGDQVDEWVVINHIATGQSERLDRVYGPEIWVDLLREARRVLPSGVRLFVNEGQVLPKRPDGGRRGAYREVLQELIARQAPLDVVGLMAHFTNRDLTPPRELWAVLDSFAQFRLPIFVTEFDIRFGPPRQPRALTAAEEELQARYTRDFLIAIFSHPAVEGVTLWGFWEGQHWAPSAALFRRDWSPKPSARVWQDLVFQQWWTAETGATDSQGRFRIRAFKGDYLVQVTHRGVAFEENLRLLGPSLTKRIVLPASQ